MAAERPTRYFTPNEVMRHNTEDDTWVSVLGKVLNLTPLIKSYPVADTIPLVKAAGTDISHWFDKTQSPPEIRQCIDLETGLPRHYQPYGRFVHIPTLAPDSSIDHAYELPWWKDQAYVIGYLTKRPRHIRIVNTLNNAEATLEVCSEETLEEIQTRCVLFFGSFFFKICINVFVLSLLKSTPRYSR